MSCVPEGAALVHFRGVAAHVGLGQVKNQPSVAEISGMKAQL